VEQLENTIVDLKREYQDLKFAKDFKTSVVDPQRVKITQEFIEEDKIASPVDLDNCTNRPQSPITNDRTMQLTLRNEELMKTVDGLTIEKNRLTQKIEDISRRVSSLQTEKDMAQIQFRVQMNELRQEREELRSKIKNSLATRDFTTQLKQLSQLREITTELKKKMETDSQTFDQRCEEMQTVLYGISGSTQATTPSSSRQFLEMGYALLQQKVIQELGLDDFYTCMFLFQKFNSNLAYGHNKPQSEKKGFLTIIYGMFSHTPRWVKMSVSGLAIFRSERDQEPMELYSLQGAKVIVGQDNSGRFDLKLALRKKICFDAHQQKNREEWVTFLRNICTIPQ
jgi:hypothetical protein